MEILKVTNDSRKVVIRLSSKGVVKDLIFKIVQAEVDKGWYTDQLILDSTDIDGDFVLDGNFKQLF